MSVTNDNDQLSLLTIGNCGVQGPFLETTMSLTL